MGSMCGAGVSLSQLDESDGKDLSKQWSPFQTLHIEMVAE